MHALVLQLAGAFECHEGAPATFPDLMACERKLIWPGASDHTIWGDAHVNWAFRAWHDGVHKRYGHDFTLAGETATCEAQIKEVLQHAPRIPQFWLDLLRAEVIGQAEYFATHGDFPRDQIAFTREYLAIAHF